jgi:hypothetical protein
MTEKRKKEPPPMPLDEALARFIQADPKELAEKLAEDVIKRRKSVERQIDDVGREIEDGGRPRKGRFRL